MTFRSYVDESRRGWGTHNDQERIDFDQLKLGCLQRIANATEAMSKHHIQLIRDRDYYQQQYESQSKQRKLTERRLAAARGQITKLRKQLSSMEQRSDKTED